MPSSPPGEAPLLRFALPDGRPATLLVGNASTVLSIDDALVSSWDLAGRPYALVRETGTYRRGLDGRLLWKREATAEGPRLRQRLSAAEGEPVVEAARRDAVAALKACHSDGGPGLWPVAVGRAPVIPRDSGETVLVIPRDPGWKGPEESAVSAPAPADPSSPGPDGAPRGDKVTAIGHRQLRFPTRNAKRGRPRGRPLGEPSARGTRPGPDARPF